MENNNWVFVVLAIVSIWFWSNHNKLKNQIDYLQDGLSSYEDALNQANSNIEDAQSYAWSSYEDMGYALDNLETVSP